MTNKKRKTIGISGLVAVSVIVAAGIHMVRTYREVQELAPAVNLPAVPINTGKEPTMDAPTSAPAPDIQVPTPSSFVTHSPVTPPPISPESKQVMNALEQSAKKLKTGLSNASDAKAVLSEMESCIALKQVAPTQIVAFQAMCIAVGQRVAEKYPELRADFEMKVLGRAHPNAAKIADMIKANADRH